MWLGVGQGVMSDPGGRSRRGWSRMPGAAGVAVSHPSLIMKYCEQNVVHLPTGRYQQLKLK